MNLGGVVELVCIVFVDFLVFFIIWIRMINGVIIILNIGFLVCFIGGIVFNFFFIILNV